MEDFVLDARMEHIRNFTAILSAVKLSKKQHVRVSVSDRSLTFVAVDDSKSLQAQANFRAEVFREYRVNAAAAGPDRGGTSTAYGQSTRGGGGVGGVGSNPSGGGTQGGTARGGGGSFGLALGSLIDVLNVFTTLDGEAELSLRWPDRDGRLARGRDTSAPTPTAFVSPARAVTP
jgi:hypothetical protein